MNTVFLYKRNISKKIDQDQDHTQGRRDTVLGLVPGRIQDLVVEIEFILEIIVEITEIIEE